MINIRTISIVFALIYFLIGCTSGEWDGPTGEQRDPKVINVIPPNGTSNVSTSENIVAFFSRDMDSSTVHIGNYYVYYSEVDCAVWDETTGLCTKYVCEERVDPSDPDSECIRISTTDSEKVAGIVTYNADKKAAVFTPLNMKGNRIYTVYITTGVKDSTGRAMLTGYTWYFKTH